MDTQSRMPETQGQNGKVADALADDVPMTIGYRPTLPISTFYGPDGLPAFYALRDVELMNTHPHVTLAMAYFKSGVYGAEFEIKAENSEIGQFVDEQCKRFWSVGVPKIQHGYDYGWLGCESMYSDQSGIMRWDHFEDFSPRDTFVLTQKHEYCGVRVKNVIDRGTVDLWAEQENVPAKGFWYAHRPRFNMWYGATAYASAWRPWRRLATLNGAEYVIDLAMYRFGVSGPTFRYPATAFKKNPIPTGQAPAFMSGRDMARQYIEQAIAGAGIALPSTTYNKEMGNGFLWDVEWPNHTMDASGILAYIEYLCDQISFGIGVPPELLQAQSQGSGSYGGREIPFEAFLMTQQQIADQMLARFIVQVLRPLVFWNYGPQKFEAKVKSLLKTRKEQGQQQGQPGAQPGMQPGMPGQQPDVGGLPGGQQPDAAQMGGGNSGRQGHPYQGPHGGSGWQFPDGRVKYGQLSMDQLTNRVIELARMSPADRAAAGRNGLQIVNLAMGQEAMDTGHYGRLRRQLLNATRRAA